MEPCCLHCSSHSVILKFREEVMMNKPLLWVLSVLLLVEKYSCQVESMVKQGACLVDKDIGENHNMCIDGYGCNYFTPIYKITINCDGISLSQLTSYIYSDNNHRYPLEYPVIFKVLDSEISILPPNAFKNSKEARITVLILENIQLRTIMPAAFTFLDRAKEIYLKNNELTVISDGIFNTIGSLRKLDISNNKIHTVTNNSLVGTNLTDLNLSNNNITQLGEVLLHFDSINSVNLSHNHIATIDFGILKAVSGWIDISFNNITEITNFSAFNASNLILNHNKITDFQKNKYATLLDISHNSLTSIGSDLFGTRLKKFLASYNMISSLNSNSFFGLHQLTHLKLDNNNISIIPNSCFRDLDWLVHLNLSGNKIKHFNYGTFDSLSKLITLDISGNLLKELPQFTIHSLTELSSLYFQDNEITDIDVDALVQHLRELALIDLSNNIWSCHRLAGITHTLKRYKVSIVNGDVWEESNIHGIECYESYSSPNTLSVGNVSNVMLSLNSSKMNSFFNEEFTKSQMYKYFNQDFIKSDMYRYFNNDFKSSGFFKYLENLRNRVLNVSKSEKLSESKLEEIASSFKNIEMDLEKISKETKFVGNDNNNLKDVKAEKLVEHFENEFDLPNYSGLLSFIAILLFIIICIMVAVTYRILFHKNKYPEIKKEEVELIGTNHDINIV